MRTKFLLCITIIASFSFITGKDEPSIKKITVIGTALHVKGNAIVETTEGGYHLYDVERWPDDHYGKKVKVTGRLKFVIIEKPKDDTTRVATWYGTRQYIKNPKWSLVE